MKKIKIISNPSSGNQTHARDLTKLINYLIEDNFIVQLFKTKGKNDAYNEALNTSSDEWDLIVVSGGDGTVNEVVHGICDSESDIPITIYSTGTVNDFATYLNLPSTPYKLYRMIKTEFRHLLTEISSFLLLLMIPLCTTNICLQFFNKSIE